MGLGDSKVDLKFPPLALELALFPHARPYLYVAAINCEFKTTAWQSAAHRIREPLTDPTWRFAEPTDEISAAPSDIPQRMGRCRYPLYFTPAMSAETFEMRRIIRNRRIKLNNWDLIFRRKPPLVQDGRTHLYWEVAPRRIDWARRRTPRAELVKDGTDIGPITMDDGAAVRASPDDGDTPVLPTGAPALRPPVGCFKSPVGFRK